VDGKFVVSRGKGSLSGFVDNFDSAVHVQWVMLARKNSNSGSIWQSQSLLSRLYALLSRRVISYFLHYLACFEVERKNY
jgi:hypothetical protein